jgi:hypothetical protein
MTTTQSGLLFLPVGLALKHHYDIATAAYTGATSAYITSIRQTMTTADNKTNKRWITKQSPISWYRKTDYR